MFISKQPASNILLLNNCRTAVETAVAAVTIQLILLFRLRYAHTHLQIHEQRDISHEFYSFCSNKWKTIAQTQTLVYICGHSTNSSYQANWRQMNFRIVFNIFIRPHFVHYKATALKFKFWALPVFLYVISFIFFFYFGWIHIEHWTVWRIDSDRIKHFWLKRHFIGKNKSKSIKRFGNVD